MYIDIYSNIRNNISINPKSTIVSFSISSGKIQISNSNTFPMSPYYSQLIEYTGKDGIRYTKQLISRSGAGLDKNRGDYLQLTPGADDFWNNLYDGAVVRLTYKYDNLPAGEIFTNKRKSVFAHILPDIVKGNQDTNNSYLPDAYICMWHPNLGRPNTYFSDSRTTLSGKSIDKVSYNSIPEHFETIHYHDFSHVISTGPFDFLIKTPNISKTGEVISGNSQHNAGGTNVMLSGFWPSGSRGGPHTSRLDMYSYSSASWNLHSTSEICNFSSASNKEWTDGDDAGNGSYSLSSGLAVGSMAGTRRRPYGYRNAVRQASNKPRYGVSPVRFQYEGTANVEGVNTTDYDAGPLVQMETTEWGWAGNGSDDKTFPTTYVGVMERLTNFTGMLGHDKANVQVRYSDGRRMTRPFGTPVRTLRNPSGVERDWWGDSEGKGVTSLSTASQYYLVDWWGNERGEDVRRAPVRGFGIRPSWDCGDAYEEDRTNSRTPYRRVWNNGKPIYNLKGLVNFANGNVSVTSGNTIPRFGGVLNNVNNNDANNLVDVFAPTHSLRVGDMGNGRGVRYPTMFNEDKLTELSSPIHTSGLVLSHNTAEPLFGNGLLRPSDSVLGVDEISRGISARLEISENGLLKPDAVVSDRTEDIVGESVHKDAISRSSPRIGLDAEIVEGIEQNHIVINTEAHSLHTDRGVGQRVILQGGSQVITSGTSTLSDISYTALSFGRQSSSHSVIGSAYKFSHTAAFRPYGGTYLIETKSYSGFFDDSGWGINNLSGASKTTNPYQDVDNYKTTSVRNNENDSTVEFLVRPIRVLDNSYIEVFRFHNFLVDGTSPQYDSNYYYCTSGGRYGLFTYKADGGRTGTNNIPTSRPLPNGDGPYIPVYAIVPSSNTATLSSFGPTIPGAGVTSYDNTNLATPVSRLVISENTLQHHRSDAPRRRQEDDSDDKLSRPDYSVKPRFSQSLHGKGHEGDVSYNVTEHNGDGS